MSNRNKRGRREPPEQVTLRPNLLSKAASSLFSHVSGASLAAFRVCFAIAMAWHLAKQFAMLGSASAIDFLYGEAAFNFPYRGFEWVTPLPQPWLNLCFGVVLVAAVLVGVGLFYRYAAAVLFVGYSYIFLLEQSRYNNHYYLMCLMCFLLAVVPAASCFSVDRWRTQRRGINVSSTVPAWSVYLLRFQLFIVYFFGGIAKLNSDWLSGVPLSSQAETLQGNLAAICGFEVTAASIALFLAWGGLFFDLSIGFLLLHRRTRIWAMIATLCFHLHNYFVFPIGVFPFLAFTATLIFFGPDWPLKLIARWRRTSNVEPKPTMPRQPAYARMVIAFIAVWMLFQVTIPLRHFLIAGDANWTEEGQDFSWRMMLRQKAAGSVTFLVTDNELQYTDAQGNAQINWEHWPTDQPQAIHVPINSHQFNWAHHPGLTVTFEPWLGHRVVQRIGLFDANAETEIRNRWKKSFGRQPDRIIRTQNLSETLAELQQAVAHSERSGKHTESVVEYIENAITTLNQEQPPEVFYVDLADFVRHLAQSQWREITTPILRRMHPFALQGATTQGNEFLSVEDSLLAEDQSSATLQTLGGDQPYLVWMDLGRLTPQDWRQLPDTFVSFEQRQLRIVWNHFRELNRVQLDRFTVRPGMIHHYAHHIAEAWQAETGRRPEVRVNSSVMLNYKYPKSLVDPRVDLAAVQYKRFTHNEWITKLKSRPIGPLARR